MKKILIFLCLAVTSLGFIACDENSTFLEENLAENGLFYPQSDNRIVDVNTGDAFGDSYAANAVLSWELNFDSKTAISSLDVLQIVGEDTTVFLSTPYGDAKVGYSSTSLTDSLIMSYTIPTSLVGTDVEIVARIAGENNLYKTRDVASFNVETGLSLSTTDVYELSTVEKYFTYELSPEIDFAVTVAASVKVNSDEAYTELWSKTYNANDTDIGITGADYNKGDTVYVQLVATSSIFTETVETSIIIDEYLIGELKSARVVDTTGYDIIEAESVEEANTNSIIDFTSDFATLIQGIDVVNDGAGLVAIVDSLDTNNLPLLKDIYDGGTTETSISNVEIGNKYVVKAIRDSKDYYGVLEITGKNESRVEAEDFVEFDYYLEEYNVNK